MNSKRGSIFGVNLRRFCFVASSQMCLNGAKHKVLVSYFGFPIVTWFNSVPERSLDTSAVSFLSRSTREEFECEATIVLSISNNWRTIGERIHYTKTRTLIA